MRPGVEPGLHPGLGVDGMKSRADHGTGREQAAWPEHQIGPFSL